MRVECATEARHGPGLSSLPLPLWKWKREPGKVQALPTPSASVEMMEGMKEGARQLCQHNSSV